MPRLSDATPVASLIEAPPEGEPLSQMSAIDGLETADYSADVSPLADLEPSEFHSGDVSPLADLESAEFAPPSTPSMALEEVETVEFVPPPVHDTLKRP